MIVPLFVLETVSPEVTENFRVLIPFHLSGQTPPLAEPVDGVGVKIISSLANQETEDPPLACLPDPVSTRFRWNLFGSRRPPPFPSRDQGR